MSRTLGKLSHDGQDVTGFVPVKCRTELGMCTGHVSVPDDLKESVKPGNYTLRLLDDREIRISLTSICGPKAYFYAVGSRTH